MVAIEVEGLVRRFGTVTAIAGVDLRVATGTVHGLLGPNGSGKTTLVRILATLLPPDGGRAAVLGADVVDDPAGARRRLSLTGQLSSVDGELTARENLRIVGRLLGLEPAEARDRASQMLDAFGLDDAADRLVKSFSGGMRRRLDIAASLIVPPEILVLDEPTTGLDPRSRQQVWEVVRGLRAAGTTVLLTTQDLAEADALADRITVLAAGRVIAEGSTAALRASVGGVALRVRLEHAQERPAAVAALGDRLGAAADADGDATLLSWPATDAAAALDAAITLRGSGVGLAEIAIGPPTLNEAFLALTEAA